MKHVVEKNRSRSDNQFIAGVMKINTREGDLKAPSLIPSMNFFHC